MNKKIKSIALGLLMTVFPFTTSFAVLILPHEVDFSDNDTLYSYARSNANRYKHLKDFNTKSEYKRFISFKKDIFESCVNFLQRYGYKRTILFITFFAQEIYNVPGLYDDSDLKKCDCYRITFDREEGFVRTKFFSNEKEVFELIF